MTTQMSDKGGFIAALDQSGGSTPGALRQYGIPDGTYSGDADMFRLMHEMRVRIMTAPAFTGKKDTGRDPVRADHGWPRRGQTGPGIPVGGSRRRSISESRQGAGAGKGRRQSDEADTRPGCAARTRRDPRRVWNEDALHHQPRFAERHRGNSGSTIRHRRADHQPRVDADHRAGGFHQEP